MTIEKVEDTGGVAEHIAQLEKNKNTIRGLITISVVEDIETVVTSVTGEARHVPIALGMIGDFLMRMSGILLRLQEKKDESTGSE